MKALLVNPFPLEGSGSGIYTKNLAEKLVQLGHKVKVIIPEHEKVYNENFEIRSIIFYNGRNDNYEVPFNFPCFSTHPRSNNTFYNLNQDEIKDYINIFYKTMREEVLKFKPDIIHAQHLWMFPYCASKLNIPYVATVHGTDLKGFRKDKRYCPFALEGARKAQKIITISEQVDTDVEKLYNISKEKRVLIHNGFDERTFHPRKVNKKKLLKKYNINSHPKYIVSFVGKFARFKGIDVLLKAAKIYESRLDSVTTIIMGHGNLHRELINLKERLNLKNVYFIGHLNQEEVSEILNITDVSAVPSREEAFGLVAIEALACGAPVVATCVGGLPDFINDAVGSLVDVEDEVGLAEAIIKEIKNPERKVKSRRAAEYALEGFSWQRVAEEVIKVYEEAIKNYSQLK